MIKRESEDALWKVRFGVSATMSVICATRAERDGTPTSKSPAQWLNAAFHHLWDLLVLSLTRGARSSFGLVVLPVLLTWQQLQFLLQGQ